MLDSPTFARRSTYIPDPMSPLLHTPFGAGYAQTVEPMSTPMLGKGDPKVPTILSRLFSTSTLSEWSSRTSRLNSNVKAQQTTTTQTVLLFMKLVRIILLTSYECCKDDRMP